MTAPLVMAWRTPDPDRARARLLAAGLVDAGNGWWACRGLFVRTERAGSERLVGPEADRPLGPEVKRPLGPRAAADVGGAPRLLALGVATVDLERAAASLGGVAERLPDDDLLGARVARPADRRVVLLEPATEGRLAATLARLGEGPCALYLAVADDRLADPVEGSLRRVAPITRGDGPWGRQALVRGEPRWGPHLLLTWPSA